MQGQSYILPEGEVAITPFHDEDKPFYNLTNFARMPVEIDGITYPTTEHYFQAQKFIGPPDNRAEFLRKVQQRGDGPMEALQEARERTENWTEQDWEKWDGKRQPDGSLQGGRKLEVMERALRAKLEQYPTLRNELISTGNSCLVGDTGQKDENNWGWGAEGKGSNLLGKMWMELRNELHQQNQRDDLVVDVDALYEQAQVERIPLGKKEDMMFNWSEATPVIIRYDKRKSYLSELTQSFLDSRSALDLAQEKAANVEQLFSMTGTTLEETPAPEEESEMLVSVSNSGPDLEPDLETLVKMNPPPEPELEALVKVNNSPDPELEMLVKVNNPPEPELENLVTVRNFDEEPDIEPLVVTKNPVEEEVHEELFTQYNTPTADAELDALASLKNSDEEEFEEEVEEELEEAADVAPILSVSYPSQTPSATVSSSDEEELFRTLGGGPTLTMTRRPKTNNAAASVAPRERHFDAEQLTKEEMEDYRKIFSPDEPPYEVLARIIQHKNAEATSKLEGKQANFNHRLKNIIPAVQFAVQGAREEYRQAKANGTQTKEQLERLQTFEHIQDMLMSLKSLNKNRSRYEKNHYAARKNALGAQLKDQGVEPMAQEKLIDALDAVIEKNIFKQRKKYQTSRMGSTEFTAQGESFKLPEKYKKRVKIEHQDNGATVSAMFSHSRSKLLGETSHKVWKTQKGEYKEMRGQVRDFVNVAISEYNKGSEKNPFNIRYIGPAQPESALAALFELKKRAYQEGRVFYALDRQGNKLEIQPTRTFSNDERKYFMSFALENPKYSKGGKIKETKTCGGYKLFRNAVEMKKPENEQDVSDAMDRFLAHELGGIRTKMDKNLENVGSELKSVAENDAWKDNSAKQVGKFRA